MLVGVLTFLAGCGSSSSTPQATSSTTAAATAALAPYLVRAGEETGYSLEGAPTLASSPAAWDKGEAGEAAESKRLAEEGFHSALTVHTTGSNRAGVSYVLELGTPSAAQGELAAQFKEQLAQQHPSSQFTVATIPGSRGMVASGGGKLDANVWFSEGSCLLLVGDLVPSGTDPQAAVTAGAVKVYERTAHSKGVCTAA